ncbi:glycosyltransferase [Methylocaldum szegediense]|uniref:N-acetylgalactosamine-N, N'-diacetylbacillosaminyl-diphospho-undecaprenol 4-alpha-N-acetylgalactosaminyltransferase n=1 Tax=Methylocaldum szegediense TaxID=73780 RepID=A0ABM9I7Q9_9GAMM|nr:glycosyltransferase [Methylocaldum szegediense]CAI8944847.1 N-acetylgalactosamine-N, N'-diacetylbacillosaminyl-diphospho-undecaprenol 4-alpha-N-acetylgalactosaminyltransferase [Methylocaldum szegediense]
MDRAQRLAVLISFSGTGGVERMVMNLLPAFSQAGVAVDLLAILRKPAPELLRLNGSGLRVLDFGVGHTALAVPGLARYLKTEKPAALLAAKDRAIRAAVLAKRLSRVDTRLVGRLGTHLSAAMAHKPALIRWARLWPMREMYAAVDRIVAVSEGVAEDTRRIARLPPEKIVVIRNPVITPDMLEKSRMPVDHPWFESSNIPVILGAGRLTRQKDFSTLIRAFARVRSTIDSRLLILGEGRLRPDLEKLAARLGIADAVSLPGHVANPYAYMARSSLFVLSSAWEGSPNVLTEALALGTPVVSTDCPSGPREILRDGRFGPLVPVGDAERLAEAMLNMLQSPLDSRFLREASAEYTVERSAARYLDVLGFR